MTKLNLWNENIGLVGHNRGTNNHFSKLKNVSVEDKITYKTNVGTTSCYINSIDKIGDTDWTKLQYTIITASR